MVLGTSQLFVFVVAVVGLGVVLEGFEVDDLSFLLIAKVNLAVC